MKGVAMQRPLLLLETERAIPKSEKKSQPSLPPSVLDVLIPEYVLTCRVEGKSPKTIGWYEQKLVYLKCFLEERGYPTDVRLIERQHLRAFLIHLQTEVKADANNPFKPTRDEPLSPHTIQGYVRGLKAFFSWAMREGFLHENPMSLIKLPKVPDRVMRTFSKEEVRHLLTVMDQQTSTGFRNYTILLLLLDTGIRASELIGLRMSDLYLGDGYLKVFGKGSKERIVPMGYKCQRTVLKYTRRFRPEPALPSINRVFLTQYGRPLQIHWLYKIVSGACKKVGLKGKRLGPHTCRHTFARSFLMNGGDLLTLQHILGHASLDMVRTYVNLDTSDLVSQQRRFSPIDMLG